MQNLALAVSRNHAEILCLTTVFIKLKSLSTSKHQILMGNADKLIPKQKSNILESFILYWFYDSYVLCVASLLSHLWKTINLRACIPIFSVISIATIKFPLILAC